MRAYLVALTGMLAMTAAAQEPRKDPPKKEPELNRLVTLRYTDAGTGSKFAPKNGLPAKHWANAKGEPMWTVARITLMPKVGDEIVEEDGDTKGTVWVIRRIGGTSPIFGVERKPESPKKD